MSTFLKYMFGIAPRNTASIPDQDIPPKLDNSENKPRNRLQKPPRGILLVHNNNKNNNSSSLLSKGTIEVDVEIAQTCSSSIQLPADQADDDTKTRVFHQGRELTQPHHNHLNIEEKPGPEIIKNHQPPQSPQSPSQEQFLDIYSSVKMLDLETLKRTRAKTPCFFIGQLDANRKSPDIRPSAFDSSITLAGQYQAVLPPRSFTPCSEVDFTPYHLRRPLRKIKGQSSLRELVTCQEKEAASTPSSSHSDSETLIGTPSLGSPTSGRFSFTPSLKRLDSSDSETSSISEHEHKPEPQEEEREQDLGFQICMDLLTRELATGLFKNQTPEQLNRASGLQILLMIEAYESIQLQVRQEIRDGNAIGARLEQVRMVEKTLDTWLGALYALYDRSKELKEGGSGKVGFERSNLSQHLKKSELRRGGDFGEFWIDSVAET